MIHLIWVAVILAAIYLYSYYRQQYSFFSQSGVKHFRPLPIVGNMGRVFLKMGNISDELERLYDSFPDERFVGSYEFLNPSVMIKDIELIKKITIKDFEYFINHRSFVDEKTDPLFGRNLLNLKGQEWKDMRSTLSPAFTSSKIRLMVPFMVEVGDQMMKALKKKMQASEDGWVDVDIKDITTRYANDIIASCAFGLKIDSHENLENLFYKRGKEASTFNLKQTLMFVAFTSAPKLMKTLKLSFFPNAVNGFFRNMVMSTMQDRESKNVIRPDMINLLMESKKGKLSHDEKTDKDVDAGFATVEESAVGKQNIDRVWCDDDLTAQALLFFVAGFETVSSTMSFLLHELALNPEVQDRLYREIQENELKNGGKFDYSSMQNLTYLDMVVSESLRLWPAILFLERTCTKNYNLGKPNSKATKDFIIPNGTSVSIPVWSLQRDPQYFKDPFKFNPERFSEENKHTIQPFTYMPFGLGPRNCIGSRFALCEVKVMVYQLLLHMEVSPCAKTCIPIKLTNDSFQVKPKGGHWLKMKART